MKRVVEEVRAHLRECEVTITYTDRPSNDFNALFALLTDPSNEQSPLHSNPNLFIYATGWLANEFL